MTEILILAAAAFLLAGGAYGASDGKAEQELIKLTNEVLRAEGQKDVPAMERLMTDDFTHTHADGKFEKKADYINDIKTGLRNYEVLDPSDMQIRVHGNSAVIIGHVHIKNVYEGKRGDTQNSVMMAWVQEQGKWRIAGWATTRGPQPAATEAK